MSLLGMIAGLRRAGVRFVVIGGLAARAHGSPRITEDLDVCYSTDVENVRRLARTLASWKAYPRSVERGLPFVMDERAFLTTPVMTLTSEQGEIDVFDDVPGVGDFDAVHARSVEIAAGDTTFRALDLAALIAAKRATGRPRDLDQIPELEALRELARRKPPRK